MRINFQRTSLSLYIISENCQEGKNGTPSGGGQALIGIKTVVLMLRSFVVLKFIPSWLLNFVPSEVQIFNYIITIY
ncbi:hypothetical protein A2Y85_05765 [candidate division WOR-3 bacterium RBG_13_43_14]|uniref:Uncharacterized protein n=1 Tax=candidate division WOR-3 bacterium RBG_13_43_14 TaxID=1802590 RepID=A0A1F4U1K7_UNCW3|nr:MAG: hypothetical protein A2Y85_05765 [candidate division WOR-3 bacterium RBG_13_43_14]